MRVIAILCSLFVVVLAAGSGRASEFGNRQEAVDMVHRVQKSFRELGPQVTFAAVIYKSNTEFHDRDLYVFIYDLNGVCVAHGFRPALVGKNLISLKDQDGKYLIQEMIQIAQTKGSGWVDYKWPHAVTNQIEDKTSYIEKLDNYFVGVGVRP